MKKFFFWCAVFVSVNFTAFAEHVTLQDAQRVAINFFFERINQYKPVDYQSLGIRESFYKKDGELILYYIFNLNTKSYVIVSADDAAIPVLAYSFETDYNQDNQAPQFIAWMNQYADQIRFAITTKVNPSKPISDLWKHLLAKDWGKLIALQGQREILPLIYSNWDQGSPYNDMCPVDTQGPGGHAYAGCVPTAMAQIMYYYRWPDHGTGSYSYVDPKYGTLYANFDSTLYQWNNMKNSITKNNLGIAELLYHLGVSCDLVYGPNGSGMYNHKSAYALRTFFKYSPETQYIFRDSTNLSWDSLIIAHLDRRMPLYYAGWSVPNINGHAFVCDGYQGSDYFHFNFGWSGSSNGYFHLDSIVAGGGSFNLAQELIINIYPDTLHYTYPQFCNGNTLLNYNQGSIEDGSGPLNNYQPGIDCNWLIDPQTEVDSITSITLAFDRLQTNPGDVVTVYDGGSADSSVLGSFSGDTTPPPLTSTGNKMLINFKTNSGSEAPGWSATYTSITPSWCKNATAISSDTIDLTDGSSHFNYHNNTTCRWNLSNTTGDTLTIYFKSFDTEPGKDLLRIFNPENTDTALVILSGHYDSLNLPQPVSSPSGKMLLIFQTNSSVTGKGWHVYSPKSTIGWQEKKALSDLRIFPNPTKEQVNLQFSTSQEMRFETELSTVEGVTVLHEEIISKPGRNQKKIDVSGFYPGIYLLTIRGKEFLTTQKIVITK